MSSAISGVEAPQQSSTTATSSVTSQLGADAFLKLLTTELRNQDPTKPMDDTQSISQLAQFSALQAQTNLSDEFQNFQTNFGVLQSAALVGRHVTVNTTDGSNGSMLTGTVASISVQNGQPYFTLDGSNGSPVTDNNGQPLLFSTTQIIGIGT